MTEATPSCCDCWCVNSSPLCYAPTPNSSSTGLVSSVMQKHNDTDLFSQINDLAWVTTARNQAESLQDFILRWPTWLNPLGHRRCYAISSSKLASHDSPSATWIDLNRYIWSQTRRVTSESQSFCERLPVSLSKAVPAGLLTLALSWQYFAMLIPMRGKHSKQVSVQ